MFDEIPTTYYERRTLSNIGDQLRIKSEGIQRVEDEMVPLLEKYFEKRINNFKIENFQSTMKADYIVDPDSLWINEAVVSYDIEVIDSNFVKNITLRIKRK